MVVEMPLKRHERINTQLTDSLTEWLTEWLSDWMTRMDERTNERMNERRKQRRDGELLLCCVSSRLSMTKPPLRWETCPLSYFFSEQLLVWATSSLTLFCSERPPPFSYPCSIASATQVFSSRSYGNAFVTSSFNPTQDKSGTMLKNYHSRSCYEYKSFSNLQLQSRIAEGSQHHWCFPTLSRANAFRHGSFTPNRPTISTCSESLQSRTLFATALPDRDT